MTNIDSVNIPMFPHLDENAIFNYSKSYVHYMPKNCKDSIIKTYLSTEDNINMILFKFVRQFNFAKNDKYYIKTSDKIW